MKLSNGWEIVSPHGFCFIVYGLMGQGTIRWAKRQGYTFKRIKVLH